MTEYRYLFGPVGSRRLGRSLGVDLVPFKVCPIDCIYCEVGRTTLKTLVRDEYVPAADILAEIRHKLAQAVPTDYITLTGSGEPTLHSRIGYIIAQIQAMTQIPVAVLTNGNLLFDPQVRQELLAAQAVLPSLDAGDEETYRRINRPCAAASFESLLAGLKAFRREYRGQLWLEVMLVSGVNDSDEQVRRLAGLIHEIQPDRIDVNTVARPPAESFAHGVSLERLERLCRLLGPKAQVIASQPAKAAAARPVEKEHVLALLRRRACTLDQLAKGLSADPAALGRVLQTLLDEGLIQLRRQQQEEYYVLT